MKKMTAALAGILTAMLLASCQKEVEIDGDVSLEKTSYDYRLKVNGTVTKAVYEKKEKEEKYVPGVGNLVYEWDSVENDAEEYSAKDWKGTVQWDNDTNSNVKKYYLTITDDRKEFPTEMTIEYYDKEYGVAEKGFWGWSYVVGYSTESHNTITNPEKSSFKVKVSYSDKDDNREYAIGETYTEYTYDLTFTR